MLNGMSLAAISEFVHEIRRVPHEAQVIFGVTAHPTGHGSAVVSVETIHAGSIRIPRRFRLPISNTGVGKVEGQWLPTPHECLLAGLGSCALIVYVQALTLRGVALDGLEVVPRLELAPTAAGSHPTIRHIGYDVHVQGDFPNELISWATERVRTFSPNHRTIAEQNRIAAFVNSETGPVSVPVSFDAHAPDRVTPATVTATHSLRLRWRFGTQIEVWGEPRGEGPGVPAFYEVDQPKQLLGIDRAPNPQEWLLAALAGELALRMSDLLPVEENGLGVSVQATGRLDLRGTLGVDHQVPTKVQDLQLQVKGPSRESAALTHIARQSIEAGVVSRLIAKEHNLVCDLPVRASHNEKPLSANRLEVVGH